MKAILAPGGKLRGYIRQAGKRKELLAPGGMLLGYYDEEKNWTYQAGGVLHGYGDQLIDLLPEMKNDWCPKFAARWMRLILPTLGVFGGRGSIRKPRQRTALSLPHRQEFGPEV